MTRFGLGGPADMVIESENSEEFLAELRQVDGPHLVLGGGTNLVASDDGYRGTILRFLGKTIERDDTTLRVESGADLEDVVRFAVENGLAGIESMMRIPGWVSGAVYGNAGAYGQSLREVISRVEIFDGVRRRWIAKEECGFRYRSSRFKAERSWTILQAEFSLRPGYAPALAARAAEIQATRDAKFPPSMKCAGSIFKNCFFADLPPKAQVAVPQNLIRDGKVPSAFFLEQVGAKGTSTGGIRVADYHANLIYNAGGGTAAQVIEIIDDLRLRILQKFEFDPEIEVQFIGFPDRVNS